MIERKVKSVRALERGLDVLLEVHRSRAASLRELPERTRLPKATLLRMLLTLSKRGLGWQRLADGAFLPSRLHKSMDRRADSNAALAELASPHLAELSRRVAWPGHRAEFREMLARHLSTLQATAAAIGRAAEAEEERFGIYRAGPEAVFPAAAK